jgi:hypothetical protein
MACAPDLYVHEDVYQLHPSPATRREGPALRRFVVSPVASTACLAGCTARAEHLLASRPLAIVGGTFLRRSRAAEHRLAAAATGLQDSSMMASSRKVVEHSSFSNFQNIRITHSSYGAILSRFSCPCVQEYLLACRRRPVGWWWR